MAIPRCKTELLAAMGATFDRLMDDLARVPENRAHERNLAGHLAGTMISPADLVAYLIGWNELVLKWLAQDEKGQITDFPETGFGWNELGCLAQKFYADYAALDWPTRLSRLEAAKARLTDAVAIRSEAELYGQPWYRTWTKGRMIQLNTSSPYSNARSRIRKWLRTKG